MVKGSVFKGCKDSFDRSGLKQIAEQQQFYFKIKSVWLLNVLQRELREIFWLQITSLIKSHLLIQLTTVYTGLYFIAAEI